MHNLALIIHCSVCVTLIIVILLQSGKSSGLSAFGGGATEIFSAPTAGNTLKTFTGWLAVAFGATSLFLTLLATRSGVSSVTVQPRRQAAQPAPISEPADAAPDESGADLAAPSPAAE